MLTTDKSAYSPKEPIHVYGYSGDLYISPVNSSQTTMSWSPLANTAPPDPGFYAIGSRSGGMMVVDTVIQVYDGPLGLISKFGIYGVAAVAICGTLAGAGIVYAWHKFRR